MDKPRKCITYADYIRIFETTKHLRRRRNVFVSATKVLSIDEMYEIMNGYIEYRKIKYNKI